MEVEFDSIKIDLANESWNDFSEFWTDVVDAITPHKLLSLRQMLNATAMDIMYYTSPLYRSEVRHA